MCISIKHFGHTTFTPLFLNVSKTVSTKYELRKNFEKVHYNVQDKEQIRLLRSELIVGTLNISKFLRNRLTMVQIRSDFRTEFNLTFALQCSVELSEPW